MELTREQAIALGESNAWEQMTIDQRALAQLNQPRLFMPFPKFHEAIEHLLGRPVWTHEFANGAGLLAEYRGETAQPTMEDILNLIPPEKRVCVDMGR